MGFPNWRPMGLARREAEHDTTRTCLVDAGDGIYRLMTERTIHDAMAFGKQKGWLWCPLEPLTKR